MRIQIDKKKHFIVSLILTLVFYFGMIYIGMAVVEAAIYSSITAIGIGVIKEYFYDKFLGRGQFDYEDILYDALGVVFGLIIIFILWFITNV